MAFNFVSARDPVSYLERPMSDSVLHAVPLAPVVILQFYTDHRFNVEHGAGVRLVSLALTLLRAAEHDDMPYLHSPKPHMTRLHIRFELLLG